MLNRLINKYINITSGFQAFQLFRFGFLFLVSIFLARIFDDKTIIGHYEKLLLLSTSLSFFWVSGIFNAFVPVYRALDQNDQNVVMGQAFWAGIPFALAAGLGVWGLGSCLYPEIPSDALAWFALWTFLNGATYLIEYYFVVNHYRWGIMTYGLVCYFLYFLAIVIPLALGEPLVVATQALVVLGLLRMLLQIILVWKQVSRNFLARKDLLKKHFQAAWPLMGALLIGGSAGYIDSFLVSNLFTNDEFAIFSYGAKELPILALVANALATVKSGEVALGNKEGKLKESLSGLKSGANRLLHIFFPVSLILLILSQWLYVNVFSGGFVQAATIFDVYLLLIIPRLLFPQVILRGLLQNRYLLITAGVELILNVSLSLWWMQSFGLMGIAAATVVAYLFDKLVLVIVVARKNGLSIRDYHPLGWWLIYSILFGLAFAAKYSYDFFT